MVVAVRRISPALNVIIISLCAAQFRVGVMTGELDLGVTPSPASGWEIPLTGDSVTHVSLGT